MPERKREVRRRRAPDEARAEILAIAARQLAEVGPAGIRLQAIADEMGVTHPAILRHFSSRAELLTALMRHGGRELRRALDAALANAGELDPAALFSAFERTYEREGYGRLFAWLVLDGYQPRGSGMLRASGERIHGGRTKRAAPLDDTLFAIVLLSLVAWADPLIGVSARRAVDLPADAATRRRFRDWVVALVAEHLR